MHVGYHRGGEVVVDDKLHSFEVDSSSHHVSANQNPDLSAVKLVHDLLSLTRVHATMYRGDTQLGLSFEGLHLVKQSFRPGLGLDEDEDRRSDLALVYEV